MINRDEEEHAIPGGVDSFDLARARVRDALGATLAAEALFDGEAETLTRKAIEKANEGDTAALRLCLERILPPRRDRPVAFKFPVVTTTADAIKASAALLEATATGHLTPGEAVELGKLVEVCIRAIQIGEIEERLAKLEVRANDKGQWP